MPGFPSPDVSALICYGIVLVFGAVVAIRTVNELLTTESNRWAFAGTWGLLFAHWALPVLTFWLLDYTTVLNDTSIFAALLVAFGYRQIFASGVQGVTLPAQVTGLWKPFQAWVTIVAGRIGDRHKLYSDRFDEKVRSMIANDPHRRARFSALAFASSGDLPALQATLAAVPPTGDPAVDNRRTVDIMWGDFRKYRSELYGWLLWKHHLVRWWTYWTWLGKGRAKLISASVLLSMVLAIGGVIVWSTTDPAGRVRLHIARLNYYTWRFLKANATDRDRWRSREHLTQELCSWGTTRVHPVAEAADAHSQARADLAQVQKHLKTFTPGSPEWVTAKGTVDLAERNVKRAIEAEQRAVAASVLLPPLLRELRFPGISNNQAREILTLLVNCHSPALNAVHVPELIESLRTQNEIVRLETRKTLVALNVDYPGIKLAEDLAKWEPKKDETPGDIDRRVRQWQVWWKEVNTKHPGTSTVTP